MANDRLSQLPVEVLVDPTDAKARVSQEPVEVLVDPTSAKARTSQVVVEVLVELPPPNLRITQVPIEVVVADDFPAIRATQTPIEVIVTDDFPAIRATQTVIEVILGRDVTIQVDPATATVSMPDVGIQIVTTLNLVVDTATATVESTTPTLSATFGAPAGSTSGEGVAPVTSFTFTVSSATAGVEAIAPAVSGSSTVDPATSTAEGVTPTLSVSLVVFAAEVSAAAVPPSLALSYVVSTASADAPVGGETSLAYTYGVTGAQANVSMADVGLVIQGEQVFTVDSAEASVEMPNVGYSETPIQVVVVGGMGAEPMPVDLIDLLTLRVEPAHWHVSLQAPLLKYYRTPEERRIKRWASIFKPKEPPQFSMQATQNVTFKVVPQNHLVIRVRDHQEFLNFAVEFAPVYFEERTSALWGDLRRRSYLDEAKDLLALHPGRSRISPSNWMRVKPPRD